jgi:hypothetical protein
MVHLENIATLAVTVARIADDDAQVGELMHIFVELLSPGELDQNDLYKFVRRMCGFTTDLLVVPTTAININGEATEPTAFSSISVGQKTNLLMEQHATPINIVDGGPAEPAGGGQKSIEYLLNILDDIWNKRRVAGQSLHVLADDETPELLDKARGKLLSQFERVVFVAVEKQLKQYKNRGGGSTSRISILSIVQLLARAGVIVSRTEVLVLSKRFAT